MVRDNKNLNTVAIDIKIQIDIICDGNEVNQLIDMVKSIYDLLHQKYPNQQPEIFINY